MGKHKRGIKDKLAFTQAGDQKDRKSQTLVPQILSDGEVWLGSQGQAQCRGLDS